MSGVDVSGFGNKLFILVKCVEYVLICKDGRTSS